MSLCEFFFGGEGALRAVVNAIALIPLRGNRSVSNESVPILRVFFFAPWLMAYGSNFILSDASHGEYG